MKNHFFNLAQSSGENTRALTPLRKKGKEKRKASTSTLRGRGGGGVDQLLGWGRRGSNRIPEITPSPTSQRPLNSTCRIFPNPRRDMKDFPTARQAQLEQHRLHSLNLNTPSTMTYNSASAVDGAMALVLLATSSNNFSSPCPTFRR